VASNKLYISKDGDWQNLYENLLKSIQNNSDISKDFYEKYHWEAIIETII
jgi:hypothetical protein